MLKILYLCKKDIYDTKMSRVRFHSMRAIGKKCDLTWSGDGWPNYDQNKTVQENIDIIYDGEQPDLVIGFKPLGLKEFSETKAPRCIRYNEMYDLDWTMKEITETKSNLVICHHNNDMKEYENIFETFKGHPVTFANIPHCAEKNIYRKLNNEKEYDLLLVGAIDTKTMLGDHYPLRKRIRDRIFPLLNRRYKCAVARHPGGNLHDAYTDRNSFYYAELINKAKICITCSGKPRSRFGKYIEIPMCGVAMAADMPGEEQNKFKEFMIEIDMSMTDEEIAGKLIYYIKNSEERKKLVDKGLEYAYSYTQEDYADQFISIVENFLKGE